jgi:hypothetical protein
MKQKLVLAITAGVAGAAIALVALLLVMRGNPAVAQVSGGSAGPTVHALPGQPDTSSSNWKLLSDDVGVMIREDDALGLRGRLYIRKGAVWLPVATDGPADTRQAVPIR